MSNEMLTRAWEVEVATHAMKIVLIALADYHNINTGLCFPSIKSLAKRTCMNPQAVIANNKKLVEEGLISIEKDPGCGRGAKSNKYTLNLGQSTGNVLGQI